MINWIKEKIFKIRYCPKCSGRMIYKNDGNNHKYWQCEQCLSFISKV